MARPSGTVTLLMSDVESSTMLWERAPKAMAEAIERHEELIRGAVGPNDGFVFKTVGDEFCIAFSTGIQAAQSALEAQIAITHEAWPTDAPIRVRMALHTGACQERGDDYFGPTVNRAARLMSVAHGGQIVASAATSALLGDTEPAGFSLSDLGLHRLRDLGRPEHVFQLVSMSLRADFPALRSLDNPDLPNNLPALLSAFVGREQELDDVRALVSELRLVTLTGAGGAGKTRLAMQAAAELLDGSGDGVWLVELAPINQGQQVAAAIASAFGMPETLEVDPLTALLRALENQRTLLILDNCEHLVDDVAKVTDAIMRSCPGVHVLATSREPLGVDGERVYRVPSMSLPTDEFDTLEEATSADAVALFVGRAHDVGVTVPEDDAALAVSVCRRLDGIPLALELAAARLTSMSLQQLSDRLDQRFRLLTGGSRSAMARQQTLQALVDWSYGLLTATEQLVLQRLSVFVGGFELEAAEAVCAGGDVDEFEVLNILHSLVEKSLVVADQDARDVRYRLLETIRQYGAAELLRANGDEVVLEVRDRHASYFRSVAARAAKELHGPDQAEWLLRLDKEVDNLRVALAHLAADPTRSVDVLGLVVGLDRFFQTRGLIEVIPTMLKAIERVTTDDVLVAHACLVTCRLIGWLLTSDRKEVAVSAELAARAVAISQENGRTDIEASATGYLALIAHYGNDVERAGALMTRAVELARQCDDGDVLCEVLGWSLVGRVVEGLGLTWDERRERALEMQRIAQDRGDVLRVSGSYGQLAALELEKPDLERGRALLETAIMLGEQLGSEEHLRTARNNLLLTSLELGRVEDARTQLRRCLRFSRLTGFRNNPGDLIFAGACIATADGEFDRAARLHGAADELRREAYENGSMYKTENEAAMEQESMARAREALGAEVFDRAYETGGLLSAPEASDLALGRRVPSSPR